MVHSLCFMSSLGGCCKLNNKVGLNARNHLTAHVLLVSTCA